MVDRASGPIYRWNVSTDRSFVKLIRSSVFDRFVGIDRIWPGLHSSDRLVRNGTIDR